MWSTLWSLAFAADDTVARGWYLWETGQTDAAWAVADALIDAGPLVPAAMPFVAAMQVERGNSPSCMAWRVTENAPEITAWEAITVAQVASAIMG